ncbi:MAG: ABC transporter ATP-binding protein [Monoglobales bacterium]
MKKIKSGALKWIAENSKIIYFSLFLTILLGVISSLTGVRLALVSRDVIDVAIGERSGSFKLASIGLFSLLFIQLAISALSSVIKVRLVGKLTIKLKQSTFSKLLVKDWQSISAHHSGELLNRINSDVSIIVNGVATVLPNFFSLIAKLVSAFFTMFLLDRTFAFIAIAIGPPVIAAATLYSRKMKSLHKTAQEAEGKTSAFMQESLQNILMIKSFESQQFMTEKSGLLQQIAYKLRVKRNTISIFASSGLFLVFSLVYYATLAWGAYRLAAGIITVGTMTAFLQLVNQIQAPFMNLSMLMPQVYSAVASAERIMETENFPDEPSRNSGGISKEKFSEIKAESLSFEYDGGKSILNDIDFEIKKNEFVAVTGESGAGKSTLVKLLLGIVSPTSGEMTIRCGEKKYFADKNTRGIFAYVPQGNMILSGTIRENIRFSKVDASDEEIERCARLADIWDYISGLKDGLDTVIGERGTGLSEGQVQRLAIARALIYDTPVLLLDEATSALDSDTERKILENIKNMTDKTCIIITHKNAALEFCNKTLHIAGGRIIRL